MSKYTRGWLLALAGLALLGAGGNLARAQQISVKVDGRRVVFPDANPIEMQGRILVPARGVFEQLGAYVHWFPQPRIVRVRDQRVCLVLPAGARQILVSGAQATIDVPMRVIAGRAMVPLRFVSESTGSAVHWDAATRTVHVVTAAAACPEKPAPKPCPEPLQIASLNHSATGLLTAGSLLVVTMTGTPDSTAAFDLAGVSMSMPMQEDPYEAGFYRGIYRVPPGVNAYSVPVIARLVRGKEATPPAEAPAPVSIDSQPPRIFDMEPNLCGVLGNARPNISASFYDSGIGVDPDSVRVLLNGRDVTRQSAVTFGQVTYTPPLPLTGPIRVRVTVADRAGNTATQSWNFVVRKDVLGIRTLNHNAAGVLVPGDVLCVTMTSLPNGRACFDIADVANSLPMREVSLGKYVGSYTVVRGDNAIRTPLIVRIALPSGARLSEATTVPVTIVSDPAPAPPMIENPLAGGIVGNTVIVRGRVQPGSIVRVDIQYRNRLTGIYKLEGTAAGQEVIADRNGNFSTQPLLLIVPAGAGDLDYYVIAMTRDPAGRASEPVMVPIRRQPPAPDPDPPGE